MRTNRIRRRTIIVSISAILASVSLIITLFLLVTYLSRLDEVADSARDIAREKALEVDHQIEDGLSSLLVAQEIANDLSSGALEDEDVEERLAEVVSRYPTVSSLTVAYAPEFVPDFVSRSLYSPFAIRGEDGSVEVRETTYDYTLPDGSIGADGRPIRSAWYHEPLEEGPMWGEPYFSPGTNEYWAGFGTPFFRIDPDSGKQVPAGVVDASMTLEGFQGLISLVDLGDPGSGYGFIVSHTGKFISYPLSEFVIGEKTLNDFDSSLDIATITALLQEQSASNEQVVVVDHTDQHSGQSSWVFLVQIELTGWWVGTVLHKDQVFQESGIQKRLLWERTGIAIAAFSFLFFVSVLLFRPYIGSSHRLASISGAFSILCVGLIGYFWFLNMTDDSTIANAGVVLSDQPTTQNVITNLGQNIPNPITIPTGILIETMEISDAKDARVSGVLWQRYTDDVPDWARPSSEPGVPNIVFPQANLEYLLDMTEIYRRRDGNAEIIGWIFQITFPQKLNLTKFPLNRDNILLRFRHRDFDRGVVLTPDLASYNTVNPTALPGIEKDNFAFPGWSIEQTFFSYRNNMNSTEFEMPGPGVRSSISDLYFNIIVEKRFITPFISHVLPLLIALMLLFGVLMLVTRDEEKTRLVGFSTATVLAFSASLFFVTAVGQISLRSSLQSGSIVYLEFFYFVTYAAILAVALNSMLFITSPNLRPIQYKDNLLVELLFWPILLGLLAIVTAVMVLDL